MISSKDNSYLNLLEKRIRGKFLSLKLGTSSIKDAKIGILLNPLKTLDEPLYNQLLNEYKNIIDKSQKKNELIGVN